jgi:hypothetical protein
LCLLQELAGVHSGESLQFLHFSPCVILGLDNNSGINHLLVFSGFWVKRGVQAKGLKQMLKKLAGTLVWPLEDF